MTLAWLQLSYRQTEAYSFSTETTVALITAKIAASLRDTACCPRIAALVPLHARNVAMRMIWETGNKSLREIGRLFGGLDYAAVA